MVRAGEAVCSTALRARVGLTVDCMTPTRAGLLGLAAAGTTATALVTRLFIRALEEIDVEVSLDGGRRTAPAGGAVVRRSSPGRD